jgi:hypothetical protein
MESNRNLLKELKFKTMQKKLKIVDEKSEHQFVAQMERTIRTKIEVLNIAYENKNGFAIDAATKDLFELLDKHVHKEDPLHNQMKNHTWQRNHLKILASISNLMQKNNRMPANTEISIEAGLSEETTYKHLKEFKENDLYKHEADKFRFMKDRVLTTVFNLAVQGDVRACKVYLDCFASNITAPAIPALEQTNYVQINNLKITASDLEQLPPATLQKIENLIKLPIMKKRSSIK